MKHILFAVIALIMSVSVMSAQQQAPAVKQAVPAVKTAPKEPTVADLKLLLAQKDVEIAGLRQRVFNLQGLLTEEYQKQADAEAQRAQAALAEAQKAAPEPTPKK